MKTYGGLHGLLIAWLLSACVSSARVSPIATAPSPHSTPSISAVTTPTLLPAADRLQQPAQQAVVDLAQRVNVEPTAIQVDAIQPDKFPAGDLGCPQPDETAAAMPAFVTGQRIMLWIGSVRYE